MSDIKIGPGHIAWQEPPTEEDVERWKKKLVLKIPGGYKQDFINSLIEEKKDDRHNKLSEDEEWHRDVVDKEPQRECGYYWVRLKFSINKVEVFVALYDGYMWCICGNGSYLNKRDIVEVLSERLVAPEIK